MITVITMKLIHLTYRKNTTNPEPWTKHKLYAFKRFKHDKPWNTWRHDNSLWKSERTQHYIWTANFPLGLACEKWPPQVRLSPSKPAFQAGRTGLVGVFFAWKIANMNMISRNLINTHENMKHMKTTWKTWNTWKHMKHMKATLKTWKHRRATWKKQHMKHMKNAKYTKTHIKAHEKHAT